MLNYEGSSSPTTQQQYQEMIKSWDATFQNLLDAGHLWQPGKDYLINQVVESPSMTANTVAKVTTPGTSGIEEPTWGAVGDTVADGTVSYLIVTKTTETATVDDVSAGTDQYKAITPAVMTQLLKDIYKQAKLDAHPVGSIYESTDSTSPSDLFGGTWEAMDPGRVLVSAGTASTGTVYTAGDKGGEEATGLSIANLPPHSFSGTTSDDGLHEHNILAGQAWSSGAQPARLSYRDNNGLTNFKTDAAGLHHHTFTTNTLGSGIKHNNMMPYEVIYRWKRIA